MQRSVLALAVVALLVLAGCNTFSDVGTTREPFDVDTVETTAGTVQEKPPVISFDPVHDETPTPFEIVDAHQDALDGRSYTFTYSHTQTYANGTTALNETVTATYAANRTTYTYHRVSEFANQSAERELYANGTHVFSRTNLPDADDSNVRLLTGPDGNPVSPRDAIVTIGPSTIRSGLLAMNFTDVQRLDTVPSTVDEPLFRVVANETRGIDPYGNETRNATLTLLVTEAGRIVEFQHAYTYVQYGETIHVKTTVRYERIGSTTVSAPDWVPSSGAPGNASVVEFDDIRSQSSLTPVLLEAHDDALWVGFDSATGENGPAAEVSRRAKPATSSDPVATTNGD